MAVVVFGAMRFPPENLDNVRRFLRELVDATRREDGCVAYDVAEDLFDPGLIRFSEIWSDAASLARHREAAHIAAGLAAASAIGMRDVKFTVFDACNPRSA